MNFSMIRHWLVSLCVLALVGCGGGGGSAGSSASTGSGAGNPILGTVSTPTAANLVLTLSASSIANNGTQTVVATAIALDANNNAVAGVPVTIAADTGVVTAGSKVTSASGIVTATISIGSNQTNRTINVVAASGSKTQTAPLQVVNSAGVSGTTPSDLLLSLSAATIASDGSQAVTATVTALDARRNILPGVVVSFSVDQGATITPASTSTGSNGVLLAAIGVGSSQLNQTITVSAAAGGLTKTASLRVAAAPATAQPVAADMSLAVSSSTIDNSGAGAVVVTATAVDGNRNALAGIPVTFSVDGNGVVTPSGTATNSNGIVTASITIGADYTNRVINVSASSGNLTRSKPISVVGAKLTASLSPVANAGSAGNVVQYKLVDTNARPMPYQTISITANGLPTVSGVTDVNGAYSYTYVAPGSTGVLVIQASSAGDSLNSAVTIASAGTTVPVVKANLEVQSRSLTPSPSVVSVNTIGSSTNQVQLRALFVGKDNNTGSDNVLIEGMRVRFDLNGNSHTTDGVVSFVGTYAYTDSSGVARATFTPGVLSSPTDGVTVRACSDTYDFDINTCPNPVTTTLTVANEPLSVSIRTDNTVGEGSAKLTYIKQFVVMVVDSAGQAKAGVQITPAIDLPSYYKGFFAWGGTAWGRVLTLASTESYRYNAKTPAWEQQGTTSQPSCPNEDVNRNGVREAPVYSAATTPNISGRQEDLNWNGELDPRKADVAIRMVGSATTDTSGLAIVQIEYGKNLASWVDFVITVTATGVKGTEAQARYSGLLYGVGNLPFPAKDVTDQNIPPAFAVSPYGRSTSCADAN